MRYSNIKLPQQFNDHSVSVHPEIKENLFQIIDHLIPNNNKTIENHPLFLYGIDLFNNQYYWECHETVEQIWKPLDNKSAEAIFLQAIIQLSIALLKHTEEHKVSAFHLLESCKKKFNISNIHCINTKEVLLQASDLIYNKKTEFPLIRKI